jgi:hypothetical protein
VQYAEKLKEEDFKREISRDSLLEPIIVNLRDSDAENSEYSDEDD